MPLLETHDLTAFYGDFQALFGVNITLHQGATIAVIGANGAGKTALLRSISGILKGKKSSVMFNGRPIGDMPASDIAKMGIAMVPEGRKLFPSLSVEENLQIGGDGRDNNGHWNLKNIYKLFPVLKEKKDTASTLLSGGQQQMVAIGRALMSNPSVLVCDELSLGLAPIVIKDIYNILPEIKNAGASVIIVEQDVRQAMSISDRVYCLMEGRITLTGKPEDLSDAEIHSAYFGVKAG